MAFLFIGRRYSTILLHSLLENFMNEAETSFEIGLLYFEMNRKKEADKYLRDSMKYYEKINEKKMVETINKLLKGGK